MPKVRRKLGCLIPAVCLVIAAEAGLYLFMQMGVIRVGYRIRQEERRAGVLEDENRLLNFKLAAAKAPGNIIRQMQDRDINLGECTDRKIVWLSEPVARTGGIEEDLGGVIPERKDFIGLLCPENIGAGASKK